MKVHFFTGMLDYLLYPLYAFGDIHEAFFQHFWKGYDFISSLPPVTLIVDIRDVYFL